MPAEHALKMLLDTIADLDLDREVYDPRESDNYYPDKRLLAAVHEARTAINYWAPNGLYACR
jgi:hypothetical protein